MEEGRFLCLCIVLLLLIDMGRAINRNWWRNDALLEMMGKEEEQAVIQRQIEQTEAQMERLEAMEGDMEAAGADGQQGFNLQELEVSVIWREIIIGDNSSQCFNFLSMILL